MTADDHDDETLILQAEELHSKNQYFPAAALLRRVVQSDRLREHHHRILRMADRAAQARDLLQPSLPPAGGGWKKHSERHGKRDTILYYTVEPPRNLLIARIETPMERSLLNPFLAVLNESDLYHTFMPRWTTPVKLGMAESKKLGEFGFGNQIIGVKIDMPYPFLNRECIQHAYAVDSIDDEKDRAIVIKIDSLESGLHMDSVQVDATEDGWQRVDFDGAFWIGPCAKDHPTLVSSKNKYDEDLILVKASLEIDAHIGGVPQRLINFFHRNVLGSLWGALLQVAEDIRDGKRAAHKEAIESNPELYDWVEKRVDALLHGIAS
jgi:hypothetical protein